ncbi:MAG TPA: PspC domain-containing protein [Candidatus Limnocylindrales bacterium]
MDDRLYRSTTDRSLSGVCGGLAAWMGLDPSLVRIAWVLLSLMSGGIFVVLYIVMAVVVPDAPPGWAPRGRPHTPGAPQGGAWGSAGTGQPLWGPGTPGTTWGGSAPSGNWGGNAPGGAWTGAPTGAPASGTPGAPTPPPADWDFRHRGDQAGIVVGIVLVVLGVWFLVRDYVPINWDLVWPVAVIALGALLIIGAARRSR